MMMKMTQESQNVQVDKWETPNLTQDTQLHEEQMKTPKVQMSEMPQTACDQPKCSKHAKNPRSCAHDL